MWLLIFAPSVGTDSLGPAHPVHRELFRLERIAVSAKLEDEEEEFQKRKNERAEQAEVFTYTIVHTTTLSHALI